MEKKSMRLKKYKKSDDKAEGTNSTTSSSGKDSPRVTAPGNLWSI